MLAQLANTLVITSIISLTGVYSYSACDDIDIHLIIDTDSIIQNSVNIEKFIQSIVWNGTSEYSAVSIALYGDDIPADMTSSIVISLDETHSVYQRAEHEQKILSELRRSFKAVTSSESNGQTISLSDAFSHSNDQPKPARLSKKESVFNLDKMGSSKMDEYFVFDHYNKLVLSDADNDDICSMMYHDRVINKNVHFIMGQTFTRNTLQIQCKNGNVFYDRVDHRTFFALPDIMIDNKKLEKVLDITCPTDINIDEEYEYGTGNLALGNHVQWIDTADIKKCELIVIKKDDIRSPLEIDSKLSYIQIDNYNHGANDNTYQINDYLLVHKDQTNVLSKLGCWSQVYRIVDIKEDIIGSGAKLFVSLPLSPTEYIMRADVSGKHPLFSNKQKPTQTESRRLFTSLVTDSTQSLFGSNITKGSIEYNYAGTTSKTISTPFSWDIVVSGSGSINSTLNYQFSTDIDLDFKFDWDLLEGAIYLYYTLNSDYSFYIDYFLKFEAELEISIDDLIKFGKYFFFFLGPVPVVIKPFVDIDLKLTTLLIEVEANLTCNYGGYDQYGYQYDYSNPYTANYGVIKADTQSTSVAVSSWSDISSIQECADINYAYDGLGAACAIFDYNPTTQLCRCMGVGVNGLTEDSTGTTLYALDKTCSSYSIDCSTLENCVTRLDTFISSTRDGCSSFNFAEMAYECANCTDNPGVSDETVAEESIKIRTPSPINGCSYGYQVTSNGFDLSTCPNTNTIDLFGFDTEVTITIGANLYTIVIVYGKGILDIPFRINIPEFDDSICSDVSSSCTDSQVMQASFDIAMDLSFYLGVQVDFTQLTTIVNDMVSSTTGIAVNGTSFASPEYETLIGVYEILDKTNLGCLEFEGNAILDALDTYYKGICCEIDEETGESVPIFIDLDGDGIDDRTPPPTLEVTSPPTSQPTTQPTSEIGTPGGNTSEPTAQPTEPVDDGKSGANSIYGLPVFVIMAGCIGLINT